MKITSNALVVGEKYFLHNYGPATYKGIRITSSGFLWTFTAEKGFYWGTSGTAFMLPYDATGLAVLNPSNQQ